MLEMVRSDHMRARPEGARGLWPRMNQPALTGNMVVTGPPTVIRCRSVPGELWKSTSTSGSAEGAAHMDASTMVQLVHVVKEPVR